LRIGAPRTRRSGGGRRPVARAVALPPNDARRPADRSPRGTAPQTAHNLC